MATAEPLNDPDYWRAKAVEARTIAQAMADPRAREHMLAAAEAYERLAALTRTGPAFRDP